MSRRAVGVVACAVVGLGVLGVVVDDGASDGGSAAAASTTTTERATSTTRRSSTTTSSTTTTTFPVGPVLSPTVEGILVMGSSGRLWTWIDLASGEVGEVEVGAVDSWSAAVVRDGIVTIDGGEAVFHPIPSGAEVSLGPAAQVFSGARDDEVWLVPELGSRPSTQAALVDLAGQVREEVVVPQPWVNGATVGGLVFNAGGRVFLAGPAGVRPLGLGEVNGVGRGGVVVRSCADDGRCAFRRLDPVRGTSTPLDLAGDQPFGLDLSLADDGRMIAMPYGPEVASVRAFDADGRTLGIVFDGPVQGRPVWLPGDAGVLVPTYTGLLHVRFDQDGLHSTEVASLDPYPSEALYVIPR